MGTVLKALLQQRHVQTLSAFRRDYDRLAEQLEPELVGAGPQKAQFYRWLGGGTSGLPQPHHCRILAAMFPGWTVAELFEPYSGHPADLVRTPRPSPPPTRTETGMAGVEAVYATRLDFLRAMPVQELFAGAKQIDMAGLSLNMLCQQTADSDIVRLVEGGARLRCLFLDPAGASIRARELEEGHPAGLLTNLTDTNIRTLERIRSRVGAAATGALEIRVYDAPIRFNITLVDALCVMQPYMPAARGVESPTFIACRTPDPGIYSTFSAVFETMWAEGKHRDDGESHG